jgi:hypothetical protein
MTKKDQEDRDLSGYFNQQRHYTLNTPCRQKLWDVRYGFTPVQFLHVFYTIFTIKKIAMGFGDLAAIHFKLIVSN